MNNVGDAGVNFTQTAVRRWCPSRRHRPERSPTAPPSLRSRRCIDPLQRSPSVPTSRWCRRRREQLTAPFFLGDLARLQFDNTAADGRPRSALPRPATSSARPFPEPASLGPPRPRGPRPLQPPPPRLSIGSTLRQPTRSTNRRCRPRRAAPLFRPARRSWLGTGSSSVDYGFSLIRARSVSNPGSTLIRARCADIVPRGGVPADPCRGAPLPLADQGESRLARNKPASEPSGEDPGSLEFKPRVKPNEPGSSPSAQTPACSGSWVASYESCLIRARPPCHGSAYSQTRAVFSSGRHGSRRTATRGTERFPRAGTTQIPF